MSYALYAIRIYTFFADDLNIPYSLRLHIQLSVSSLLLDRYVSVLIRLHRCIPVT